MRRVVITGLGAISALGEGMAANFAAALEGRSGVSLLNLPQADAQPIRVAAQIGDELAADLTKSETTMFDRVAQLAWVAAREAIAQSGMTISAQSEQRHPAFSGAPAWAPHIHCSRLIPSCSANHKDRLRPFTVVVSMNNGSAALLSLKTGFKGPLMTYSSACASSSQAIGEAFRHIRHGYCDFALTGGSEALLIPASLWPGSIAHISHRRLG